MATLVAGRQHLRDVQAGEAPGEEAQEDGLGEAAVQVCVARAQDNQQVKVRSLLELPEGNTDI